VGQALDVPGQRRPQLLGPPGGGDVEPVEVVPAHGAGVHGLGRGEGRGGGRHWTAPALSTVKQSARGWRISLPWTRPRGSLVPSIHGGVSHRTPRLGGRAIHPSSPVRTSTASSTA